MAFQKTINQDKRRKKQADILSKRLSSFRSTFNDYVPEKKKNTNFKRTPFN